MTWKQVRDADMNVGYTGGWCLKYVQDAFGTDHIYPRAIDEWDDTSASNHTEVPPLGITVPVFFSLGNVPAGHVAIRLSDGWVASSTQPGVHSTPYYHKSLDDLIAVYGQYNGGCTYLGWSEVVGSEHVVEYQPDGPSADQINQDYLDILERPADQDGLHHYLTNGMNNDQIRADLLNSAEYQALQAKKAAEAAQPVPNPVIAPIHNPDPVPVPEPTPVVTPIPVDTPPSDPVVVPVTVPVVAPPVLVHSGWRQILSFILALLAKLKRK